jgi:hypothetical protein
MNDLDQTQDNELEQDGGAPLVQDELAALKQRADLMGLKYHPSISAAKLAEKISAHLQGDTQAEQAADADLAAADKATAAVDPSVPEAVASGAVKTTINDETGETLYALNETPVQKRQRLRRQANELVRIRVTCMNPAKKDWAGEIFTTGNSSVGTLRKFVPFNAEEGWYVPRMILQVMQERQCQIFVNGKSKNGVKTREPKLIKEFAIEVLPDLTEIEIKELARRQAMTNGQEG